MSAAVMAPTPALPQLRKTSVWEKMFSGLKRANKKDDPVEIYEPMSISDLKARNYILSTGYDSSTTTVHKRHSGASSEATKKSAAPSIKSTTSRAASVSSNVSRRSSKSSRWWRSSNPEDDELPPVPTIDIRFANEAYSNSVSPSTSRRPSYMPRNAAGSFLRSTTTPAMKKSVQENLDAASTKLSLTDEKSAQVTVKPIQIKTVELRKDSHAPVEDYGLHSMAGACDVLDDVPEPIDEVLDYEHDVPLSPTQQVPDKPTRFIMERADSARSVIDHAAKIRVEREAALLTYDGVRA